MGEVGIGGGRGAGPRLRVRTLRRWAPPVVAALLMVVSLAGVVRRTEEGRRLSRELDRLEAEQLVIRDRVAEQEARAESLSALPRIEEAAGALGLRQAGEGEIFHLSDRRLAAAAGSARTGGEEDDDEEE